MANNQLQAFQNQVSDLLIRHRSFLDITSKFQESNARINRAVMKAITECGCLNVSATKQPFPKNESIVQWKKHMKTHLNGQICDHCLEIVISEMGKNLFYLTALCNLLKISLDDVIKKEADQLSTLGIFNFR